MVHFQKLVKTEVFHHIQSQKKILQKRVPVLIFTATLSRICRFRDDILLPGTQAQNIHQNVDHREVSEVEISELTKFIRYNRDVILLYAFAHQKSHYLSAPKSHCSINFSARHLNNSKINPLFRTEKLLPFTSKPHFK